jgi:hypothetical protein
MARRLKKDGPPAPADEAPASPVERPKPLTLGREIVAILLFSATLLTVLALVSYSPYDPGAFSFGTASVAPRNWVGILGAFWSSLLVHILGLTAN